jgi:hypothetical protein
MVRNYLLFDRFTLTDPVYLEAVLSHRMAYNRMTWFEWMEGWIYYLPDFGDSLARWLFGNEIDVLAQSTNGYNLYGVYVLHPQVHAITAPDLATWYLIKTYALGDPVKYIAVTALLTWRGIFVGQYVALLGLACLVGALRSMPQRQRELLAMTAIFGFAIAVLQGAMTPNIVRYNLAVTPIYAISVGWFLGWVWAHLGAIGAAKPGGTQLLKSASALA